MYEHFTFIYMALVISNFLKLHMTKLISFIMVHARVHVCVCVCEMLGKYLYFEVQK